MQFLDITGKTLQEGQRVAFARTRGGTLALGVITETRASLGVSRGPHIGVLLDSNRRAILVPYHQDKFVILADTPPRQPTLTERAEEYMRGAGHGHIVGLEEIRLALDLPFTQAHNLYFATEGLVTDGLLTRGAMPYTYLLTEE